MLTLTKDQMKAALLAAPTSDVRYYLNSVAVEAIDATTAAIVSTNGNRLHAFRVIQSEPHGWPVGKTIIVPRDLVAQAVKTCTRKADAATWSYVQAADTVDNQGRTIAGAVTIQFEVGAINGSAAPVDTSYPDWRRVVPAKCSSEVAQFQGNYIADAQEFLALVTGKNGARFAPLQHNGPGAALMVYGDALAVVMPFSAGEVAPAPAWATTYPKSAMAE